MQLTYTKIWKMSYPILISMLMQQLVGITDVIYMGRLGEVELGASALGSTYFLALFMVVFGFSIGAQIIMARRNGEGQYHKIGEVFHQGTAFIVFMSICFILLSKLFTQSFFEVIIENEATYRAALEYTDWRIYGLVCASLMMMARAFFVAIITTRVLTMVSIIMVLSNIVLNYVLIFGKFGLPRMGISGAALASDLAELIAVITYVVYFIIKIDLKKYGLVHIVFNNFVLLKSILKISIWTMLQKFSSISTWFLFFVAIEHISERALAVSNLLRSLSYFPYVVINALAAIVSSITSNLIGEGRWKDVIPSCAKVMKLCTFIVMPIIILMLVFIRQFLMIYTDNVSLIEDAVPAGIVMILSNLPLIPAWVLFNAVFGTGNTRYAMAIEIVAMIVYVLFIGIAIIYLQLPLPICWCADLVYDLVILAISVHYIYSLKWCDKKI